METHKLGDHGPDVGRFALGAMTFGAESDEEAAHAILDAFVEGGGTLVDTADVYQAGVSEEMIGRWLAARDGMRERIVLATKGRFEMPGQPGHSLRAEYLHRALDASLQRLGVDHVDLYQVHGPDDTHGVGEVAAFFTEAVGAGKVRFAGVSNLRGWETTKVVADLAAAGGPPLVSHQPQYSLLVRETEWEYVPACLDAGIGMIPWGPLAAGWLTGKYHREGELPPGTRIGEDPDRGLEAYARRGTERTWAVLDALREVADGVGSPMHHVALAWLADRPVVTAPIIGARTADQLRDSLQAADLHLDADVTARLDEVSAPPVPDYPYTFAAEQGARVDAS